MREHHREAPHSSSAVPNAETADARRNARSYAEARDVSRTIFDGLAHPIVQAPLSGGPATPELAAAVSGAGGLGFLAAGYKSAAVLSAEIERVRELTPALFGVNLFVLEERPVDAAALDAYRDSLAGEAARYGVTLGHAHFDDDDLDAKIAVLADARVAVVSTAFGCPSSGSSSTGCRQPEPPSG